MPHSQMDSAAQAADWGTVALHADLVACYTTAQDIGATGAGREFAGDDRFVHFNCQLTGTFHGRLGRRWLEFSAGDLSVGQSAGERFQIRHCAQLQNIEVMVTPDVLATLAADATIAAQALRHRAGAVWLPANAGMSVTGNRIAAIRASASMLADALMDAAPDRHRPGVVDWLASASMAPPQANRQAAGHAVMLADTLMVVGYEIPRIRRMTEAGEIRLTQQGGVRVLEYDDATGNVVLIQPPYRIYYNDNGVWRVLDPYVKFTGTWRMPGHIYTHSGGFWLPVRSHL